MNKIDGIPILLLNTGAPVFEDLTGVINWRES